MKINLYYWNNGVGVVNDVILIKSLLKEHTVILYDISKNNEYEKSDLGIFVQNINPEQLENNKKNLFIINEEWLTEFEISYLSRFDYLITKSNYAKKMLDIYHRNVIKTGFFSLDRYFFPQNTGEILHFKGKSIQKNTELVYKYRDNVKILDSNIDYLSELRVNRELNTHDIHICCSLYEGWGHYLWEAMSCGKLVICSEIPVFKEYLDPDLVKFVTTEKIIKYDINSSFLKETKYTLREGHFINENEFKLLMDNKKELLEFQQKHFEEIRNFFIYINNKNKQKFFNTIMNL